MFQIIMRIIAVLGALFILAIGLAVLVNLNPQGAGGVVVWALLLGLLLLLSYGSYRAMVGGFTNKPYRGSGVGAGLIMGAGVEKARRDDEDFID